MGGDNLGDDFKICRRAPSDRARARWTRGETPFGEMLAGVALDIAIWDSMTHAAGIARNQALDSASSAITPRWAVGLISRNAVKAAPDGTARLVPELRHAV
jgi:hypothetical protein